MNFRDYVQKEYQEDDPEVREGFEESQKHPPVSVDKDHEIEAVVCMLKEAEAVTLAVFESLLPYIGGKSVHSTERGRSLVSRMMQNRNVACQEEETQGNEFEKVDAAWGSLISKKAGNFDEVMSQVAEMK
ncbi:uncharacterized protein LOC127802197 [Diospyros lotus]|uniref:uncharacterized protein LOC127802197 n=1 Tax=Diospyros lotus TaxID=55363 RepID=UPI0022501FF5|nr:uncharacterized protein LOC127802197 [Diospyros lotus]